MMLFFGLFCLSPMIGVRETLGQNMNLFYWELEPYQLGLLPFFTIASYFLAVTVVAPITKRFDKGGAMRIAVGIAAVAASLHIILRSFDLLPANGHPVGEFCKERSNRIKHGFLAFAGHQFVFVDHITNS